MTHQRYLFDRPERARARTAARRGMDRAAHACPKDVRAALGSAIAELARVGQPFTAEDVWNRVPAVDGSGGYDGRVLGALLKSAQTDRLIQPTGRWVESSRVVCHGRPMREWRGTCST